MERKAFDITTEVISNAIGNSSMSDKEKVECALEYKKQEDHKKINKRDQNFKVICALIATSGVIFTAISLMIAANIANPPQSLPSPPQDVATNYGNMPIGFEEDYNELLNIYDDCIDEYNNSKFQAMYDDIQSDYLILEDIFIDCQNAYENDHFADFINNSIEIANKNDDFHRKIRNFREELEIIISNYEQYKIRYNDFEEKYFSDFLYENRDLTLPHEVAEIKTQVADRFRTLSEMIDDSVDKLDDINNKLDVNKDKTENLVDKVKDITAKAKQKQ